MLKAIVAAISAAIVIASAAPASAARTPFKPVPKPPAAHRGP